MQSRRSYKVKHKIDYADKILKAAQLEKADPAGAFTVPLLSHGEILPQDIPTTYEKQGGISVRKMPANKIPFVTAVRALLNILGGLVQLHAAGIQHGSLIANNVLYNVSDGMFRMVNFLGEESDDIKTFCNVNLGIGIFRQLVSAYRSSFSTQDKDVSELLKKVLVDMHDKKSRNKMDVQEAYDAYKAFVDDLSFPQARVSWEVQSLYGHECTIASKEVNVTDVVFNTEISGIFQTQIVFPKSSWSERDCASYVHAWAVTQTHAHKKLRVTRITQQEDAYKIILNDCIDGISFSLDHGLSTSKFCDASKSAQMRTTVAKLSYKLQYAKEIAFQKKHSPTKALNVSISSPHLHMHLFANHNLEQCSVLFKISISKRETITLLFLPLMYKPKDMTPQAFGSFLVQSNEQYIAHDMSRNGDLEFMIYKDALDTNYKSTYVVNQQALQLANIILANVSQIAGENPNAEAYRSMLETLKKPLAQSMRSAQCYVTSLPYIAKYLDPALLAHPPRDKKSVRFTPSPEGLRKALPTALSAKWTLDNANAQNNFQETYVEALCKIRGNGKTKPDIIKDIVVFIKTVLRRRIDKYFQDTAKGTAHITTLQDTGDWNNLLDAQVLSDSSFFANLFVYDVEENKWWREPVKMANEMFLIKWDANTYGILAPKANLGLSITAAKTPEQLGLVASENDASINSSLYKAFTSAGLKIGITWLKRKTAADIRTDLRVFQHTFQTWTGRSVGAFDDKSPGNNIDAQNLGHMFNVTVAVWDAKTSVWSVPPVDDTTSDKVYLSCTEEGIYKTYAPK